MKTVEYDKDNRHLGFFENGLEVAGFGTFNPEDYVEMTEAWCSGIMGLGELRALINVICQ